MPPPTNVAKTWNPSKGSGMKGNSTQGGPPRFSPHSIDAEQAVIASCILEGGQESVGRCIEAKISAASFYKPAHQIIFQALVDLYTDQIPVDEVILGDKLMSKKELEGVGGLAYINEIVNRIETHAHLSHYILRVRDTSLMRSLIRTCQNTVEQVLGGQEDIAQFINDVEQEIFQLSEMRISDETVSMEKMMESATKQVSFLCEHRGAITGVPTGFKDLDMLTTGFHAPQMVVVAARPGMGKTSMALNIAEAAILPTDNSPGIPTLMFSLEMGADELALRMLCSRARASSSKLKEGFLSSDKMKALSETALEMKKAPFYVDDSASLNILEIRAKARRVKASNDLGMVIIDYLQLVNSADSRIPRHEQMGEVSRGIKAMAKELRVPVIALCQLNRETEKEKRQPRMSDLRESGSIEQDADIVLLISQKAKQDQEVGESNPLVEERDLIIAKQRNGPTGIIPLIFNASITRFENATRNI